ncbi:MAG: hypothetical protein ACOYIP_03320 [Coriobacteriales bacterium]|jgi:hypothetical protein
MCMYCDSYADKMDIPALAFTMESGDACYMNTGFDPYITQEYPPRLCVVATYSDTEGDFDRVYIPINYCPICGQSL